MAKSNHRIMSIISPHRHLQGFILLALALLSAVLPIFPAVAQREVTFTASVDKTMISADEQLSLELILSGPFRNANKPDFPQLADFYVVSSGQSSQFSLVNNQMSSRVVYSYRLQPTREGTLIIPSISIIVGSETYSTEPISVEVTGGSAPSPQPVQPSDTGDSYIDTPDDIAGQNFYVEAEVDNNTPYVSQQIIYTFRLYQRVNFSRQPSLDWPEFTGFLGYDLTPNNQYNHSVGNQQYLVTEVRRILFPTAPGFIILDPTILSVPGDIFTQGFLLQTNEVTIDVKPLPMDTPEGFTGAVGQFEIASWVEPTVSKVNEPVSLFVKINGTGNINTLPDPTDGDQLNLTGWRVYDPQVTINTTQAGNELQGDKTIERLLLPTNAGLLTIPPFFLDYFDPVNETYQRIETESLQVSVAEGAEDAPSVVIVGEGKDDIEILGADIRHIKPAPTVLGVAERSLILRPIYWIGWGIPLLILISTFTWRRYHQNLERNGAYARKQRALTAARKRLRGLKHAANEDTVYAEVTHTLTQYLGDKLNQSSTGLTREGICKSLAPKVSPELVDRLLLCLDWADSGRFAPAAEGRSVKDLVMFSQEIIDAIDKVLE